MSPPYHPSSNAPTHLPLKLLSTSLRRRCLAWNISQSKPSTRSSSLPAPTGGAPVLASPSFQVLSATLPAQSGSTPSRYAGGAVSHPSSKRTRQTEPLWRPRGKATLPLCATSWSSSRLRRPLLPVRDRAYGKPTPPSPRRAMIPTLYQDRVLRGDCGDATPRGVRLKGYSTYSASSVRLWKASHLRI